MPEPTVRAMLVAKVDELVDVTIRDLGEIRAVTVQLEPSRPGGGHRSCGVVLLGEQITCL
jgi:hypothetical protein